MSERTTRTFTTEDDITLGDKVIIPAGTEIAVRKPDSGAMRGLQMLPLTQLDVDQLEKLAPRITHPVILKGAEVSGADRMQFGLEVLDFLMPTVAKQAASLGA